jgi:hypothetical protein
MPPLCNAPDPPNPVAPALSKILRNSANRPLGGQTPYGLNWGTTAIRIWSGTVRSASKTIDIDNVNRVLLQPHWQKESDLVDY